MLKKIYTSLIVLFPILSGYGGFAGIDLGSILLLFAGVVYLALNFSRFSMKFPKGYVLFLVLALLITFFVTRSIQLRLILYSFNLVIACCFVDKKCLYTIYSKVVLFSCIFFLVQEIMYITSGYRISGLLPFLPTIYGGDVDLIATQTVSERSASFFLEPSYFAQYLFPFIALSLVQFNTQGLRYSILVSLIVLLTRSGNGILLLAIIWGIWLFFSEISVSKKVSIIVVGIIGLYLVLLLDPELLTSLFDRSAELTSFHGDERFMSSGFIRIFRGYFLYSDLPTINKLFGASEQLIEAIKKYNIFFIDENTSKFLNGTQMLLIHNGLIVTVCYFRHLFLYYNKFYRVTLVLISCFVFLMCTESYYLTSRAFLVSIILYIVNKNQDLDKTINRNQSL